MRLCQRRVARERRLVRGDRAVEIAGIGEPHAALQDGAGVLSQGRDRGQHRIDQRRPARTILFVPRQRRSRLVEAAERAIRQRQPVVRRAQLGEERHGALEMRDGRVVLAAAAAAIRPSPTSAAGLAAGSSTSARKSVLLSSRSPDSSSASASLTRAGR